MKSNIAILVLAAGASTRMGTPKQLLKIGHETLLNHALSCAKAVSKRVVVVTGAGYETLNAIVAKEGVIAVYNPDWASGMGSSIKTGVRYLLSEREHPDAVIVTVCDQPYLHADHLRKLTNKFMQSDVSIVVSHYAGVNGTPVLFGRAHFNDLLTIGDHEGARRLWQQENAPGIVEFEKGEIDLDTPGDYKNFLKENNNGLA